MRAALRRAFCITAGLLLLPLASGAVPDTHPAPADEVMRSTQRSLRLTPALARAFAHLYMHETPWKELELTAEQEERIREAVSRRMMEVASQHGSELQPILESGVEMMVLTEARSQLTPERVRDYGQRLAPIVPVLRELVNSMPEVAGPVLTPQQQARLQEGIKEPNEILDLVEQRFKLMADGRFGAGRNPFDDLDGANKQSPEPESTEQKAKRTMRYSRESAENETRRAGVTEWRVFLQSAGKTLRFDEAQKARGEAILADYGRRADAIKTPDWRQRLRDVLTWQSVQWDWDNLPRGPWAYRLERARQELMKPIEELGRSFYKEVLALATPEQWTTAVGELRRFAESHGLPPQERPDEPMNLLPSSQERGSS